MIVLVTGSRQESYSLEELVYVTLNLIHEETPITLIIFGACVDKYTGKLSGADRYAMEWAIANEVDFNGRPARWRVDGYPQAGPMRNGRMCDELDRLARFPDGLDGLAREAHRVVAFPGGRGTANCATQAKNHRLTVEHIK